MARTLAWLRLLGLLAPLTCSGCAFWNDYGQGTTGISPNSSAGNGGPVQDALQSVSNASRNNWNFEGNRKW
jgi:hypothetical protein